ncbi:hypothetical protein TNCV_4994011 [Trichonephila clavipes]|nr:hypothetical protein TNCV_4994011 [Trichonephila clavipes]
MLCLSNHNVAQYLLEFPMNPLVKHSVYSTPLASQKMVSMTFAADIKFFNFWTLGKTRVTIFHGLPLVFWVIMMNPGCQSSGSRAKWICCQPESFFMDGRKKLIERMNECVAVKMPD